ncbi:hypothetical protein BOX15_Mlig033785g1, partial [Macrostomum lignano]
NIIHLLELPNCLIINQLKASQIIFGFLSLGRSDYLTFCNASLYKSQWTRRPSSRRTRSRRQTRSRRPAARPKGGDDGQQQQQQTGGYSGKGDKADLDNHAKQLNPNNWRFKGPQSN